VNKNEDDAITKDIEIVCEHSTVGFPALMD